MIILNMFLLMILAIFVHEMGHIIYFRWKLHRVVDLIYTPPFRLRVGYAADYISLTKAEKLELYAAGVIIGMFPLWIAAFVNVIYGIVLLAYVGSCRSDISKIYKLVKER